MIDFVLERLPEIVLFLAIWFTVLMLILAIRISFVRPGKMSSWRMWLPAALWICWVMIR